MYTPIISFSIASIARYQTPQDPVVPVQAQATVHFRPTALQTGKPALQVTFSIMRHSIHGAFKHRHKLATLYMEAVKTARFDHAFHHALVQRIRRHPPQKGEGSPHTAYAPVPG